MQIRKIKLFRINFPTKRTFSWRALLTLVILYFLGNLGGVPLLRKTDVPIEPVWFWGLVTLISALVIALSLALANRTSLGAPLLEGRLPEAERSAWFRSGFGLTLLLCVAGTPFSLLANRDGNLASYPFGWQLLPASFKAGIVEEIIFRFFLVSLFVWFGSLIKRDHENRPIRVVYWGAILLVGLLFGWGHVDARLGHPMATFWDYALIMALSSMLGIYFGWLFWRLGLEWAMFAHFAYDAYVSMVLVPVNLLKNPLAWAVLILVLLIASAISWRLITQIQT